MSCGLHWEWFANSESTSQFPPRCLSPHHITSKETTKTLIILIIALDTICIAISGNLNPSSCHIQCGPHEKQIGACEQCRVWPMRSSPMVFPTSFGATRSGTPAAGWDSCDSSKPGSPSAWLLIDPSDCPQTWIVKPLIKLSDSYRSSYGAYGGLF